MIMNVLCIGMISIASLFSAVKNYFALPPQQIEEEVKEEKGIRVCQGHRYGIITGKYQKGFKEARKEKESLDEQFSFDNNIKEFTTEIVKTEQSGWECDVSYVHIDGCSECYDYELVNEELYEPIIESGIRICRGHSDHLCPGRGDKEVFTYLKNEKEEWEERFSYDRSMKEYHCELYKEEGEWNLERYWTHVDGCSHCDCYDLVEEMAAAQEVGDRS